MPLDMAVTTSSDRSLVGGHVGGMGLQKLLCGNHHLHSAVCLLMRQLTLLD